MQPGISAVKRTQFLHPLLEMGLLVLSAALFSFSFPNPIFLWGCGPLAFISLWPLFVLINRTSWPRLFFYAPVAGLLTYTIFNYWLAAYHPLALLIVSASYAVWYLLLFPVLKSCRSVFPRYGWILQLSVWVSWEYVRTLGFLGYPYGILGYSQFTFLPFANFASSVGIWGLSALIVWPSVLLAWSRTSIAITAIAKKRGFPELLRRISAYLLATVRSSPYSFGAWIVLMALALVVGTFSMVDYHSSPTKKIALIQQNVDPWIGGTPAYAESLQRLVRQTDRALAAAPNLDMVVWSETSFVPAIEWHWRFRDDADRFELVRQLKEYLGTCPVPVVLGNGEAEPYLDLSGVRQRRDFNAVLLYDHADLKYSYRKMRLVPFTEYFPYKTQLPWLYDLLVENRTSFWEEGEKLVLMHAAGFTFGTPICYEDSFPDVSRNFVNAGAQMIINLSNDSWSKSVPAAMQHLAMASFRAIETRRTVVRSTNGGMSGLIDPNGKIIALNEPFTESFLVVDAPLYPGSWTPALAWGDWFALASIAGSGFFFVFGFLRKLMAPFKRARQNAD